MKQLRYIHCGDMHLDSPFRGLIRDRISERVIKSLREAPYAALKRLVSLCASERPDFLVLAGDIYNKEDASIRAQLELRDACAALQKENIPVFIVHGNHDPLSSRMKSIQWPENAKIFAALPQRHVVYKDGAPIAVVHGMSHANDHEERNLAVMFERDGAYDCFQLGLLHCAVENAHAGDRYAPCTLDDLKATGLDAWALGHEHGQRVLSERPFIAYCGNFQGLHINETGPKGCWLITASQAGNSWQCQAQFRQLAPIQWEKLAIDLDGLDKLDAIDDLLTSELEQMAGRAAPSVNTIITRLLLTGKTRLDALLRSTQGQDDLYQRLSPLNSGHPGVYLKDIEIATSEPNDENLALRDDLPGQCARIVARLTADSAALGEFCGKALEPLYGHGYGRKFLTKPDETKMRELLDQAARLCQKVLESK